MIPKSKKLHTTHKVVEKGGDILSRAKSIDKTEQFAVSLFYGRTGTGKTTLASTFPSDLLFMDFKDKGASSIKNVPGVKVLTIETWDMVEEVYWALKDGKHSYKTVVLDTIDGMQKLGMTKIKNDHNKDESEAMSQREWGELSGLVLQWLFFFRDLNMNVVFLSQERIHNIKDEEDAQHDEGQLEPEVGPAVIPSIARGINAAVNIIGNTFIRQSIQKEGPKTKIKTSFMLRLGPHPFYTTKIRKPKEFITPAAISNPTYGKIMNIIKGETTNA